MRENRDQKKLRIWTLFSQWKAYQMVRNTSFSETFACALNGWFPNRFCFCFFPQNSSNDSASLQQMTELNQARLNRGKQNANTSFKVHHEPDSPQSSMTSSGLTSISQFRGQPIMPSPLFQKYESLLLQKNMIFL